MDPQDNFRLLPDDTLLEMIERQTTGLLNSHQSKPCRVQTSKTAKEFAWDSQNDSVDMTAHKQSKARNDNFRSLTAFWNIIHTIHLPFNENVFRHLADAVLDDEDGAEASMPRLLASMRIYSQHSVMVAKTEKNHRYLCSGCSFSSVHGVAHVRRHILGTHCHLSPCFRQIGICCSRLSSGTHQLMPESQLKQLAAKNMTNGEYMYDKSPSSSASPGKRSRSDGPLTPETIGCTVSYLSDDHTVDSND